MITKSNSRFRMRASQFITANFYITTAQIYFCIGG